MKKISVYVKGDRNSTAYYRIYQYFDRIAGVELSYHIMYPLWVQNNYMPVSKQSKFLQVVIYIVAVIKVFCDLLKDSFIANPDVIVVHKRIISKFMPATFRFLLNRCHANGSKIIWDYDDHLVEGHEMSQSTFNYFASLADNIVVTHEYLKSLLPESEFGKVNVLPTTDGDMYELYEKNDLLVERKRTLSDELRLVWVATSGNIKNLLPVIPYIDKAAENLKLRGMNVTLQVICDKPVEKETKALRIENIKWTREAAILGMRSAHIGIMPLQDNEFNRGKGGFKLVQYLSIGLPCIGSRVGFNEQVISQDCGILTNDDKEWTQAIIYLSDCTVWESYASCAYKHWQESFSFENNLKFWRKTLI